MIAVDESPQFAEAHRNRLRSPDGHRGSEAIGPPKEMFAGPNVFEMHEVISSAERRSV